MKQLKIFPLWMMFATLLVSASVSAADRVAQGVLGNSSTVTQSATYRLVGTTGQAAINMTGSAGNNVKTGFWQVWNALPITITISENPTLLEGESQNVTILAVNPTGGVPALSASGVPAFGTFSGSGSSTGTLSLSPQIGDAGTYSVTVTAGAFAVATITVTVLANDVPVLATVGDQVVGVGLPRDVAVSATDANATPLTLSVSGPNFVSLTDNSNGTGVLSMAPQATDVGAHSVTVSVSDGVSTVSETFTVTVRTNVAPELAAIGAQSVPEDTALNLTLSASDADGDLFAFSVSAVEQTVVIAGDDVDAGGDPLAFSVSGDNLTVTPSLNFNGEIAVTVTVTDDLGATDAETFVLTVTPVNDPAAGVIVTAIPEIPEDSDVVDGQLGFVDRDGDAITLSVSTPASHGTATVESTASSGLHLAGTPVAFGYQPNPDFYGTDTFEISATDGQATQVLSFEVVVTPVSDPVTLSPLQGAYSMEEGEVLEINIESQDVDLTFAELQFFGVDPALKEAALQRYQQERATVEQSERSSLRKIRVLNGRIRRAVRGYYRTMSLYSRYLRTAQLEPPYGWMRKEWGIWVYYTSNVYFADLANQMLERASTTQARLTGFRNTVAVETEKYAQFAQAIQEIDQKIADLDTNSEVLVNFATLEDFGDGTGKLTIQPDDTQSGYYSSFRVKVVAPDGGTAEQVFTLTVHDVTQPGENVFAQPVDTQSGSSPVTMTFENVTASGNTSLNIVPAGSRPPVPPNFRVTGRPPKLFDLTTTAQFDGYIELSFSFAGIQLTRAPRLLHYEGGGWVDITTSIDRANKIVRGRTQSLSPFAIAEPTTDGPEIAINEALVVDEGTTAVLTNTSLQTTDNDTAPDALVYTVVDTPLAGDLLLNGTKLQINDTFTQQDIENFTQRVSSFSDSVRELFLQLFLSRQ